MKMKLSAMILALALLLCAPALAEDYHISEDNMTNFSNLLTGMMLAYEQPSEGDDAFFDMALEAIGSVSDTDLELATAILDHWRSVYLNPNYPLYLYQGEESAETLAVTNIPDSPTHAFVVLGVYGFIHGNPTLSKEEIRTRTKRLAADLAESRIFAKH